MTPQKKILKISSIHNSKIKHILSLSKSSERKEKKLFVIEGLREISVAAANNIEIVSLFYCAGVLTKEAAGWLRSYKNVSESFEVSRQVYSRIAYRENIDGLVVIARAKDIDLNELDPGRNPLILVLESVEKPGNLGAILRSADAARINAVIICDPTTDIYNPNVIRSSIGCIFSNQVVTCTSESAIAFLDSKKIRIYAAALQDAVPFTEVDFSGSTAIVIGSEAKGLSAIWREKAYQVIKIPMSGMADSLNVSVSAALLVFEAVRQRMSKGNQFNRKY